MIDLIAAAPAATTPLMEADRIAFHFNAAAERQYWKATIGGARTTPRVHFVSRSSMVEVHYYVEQRRFTVTFNKAICAWGDFMTSAHKALTQIHLALKAAGLDMAAPFDTDDGVLRIEFDTATKTSVVSLARVEDDWETAPAGSFKVLE